VAAHPPQQTRQSGTGLEPFLRSQSTMRIPLRWPTFERNLDEKLDNRGGIRGISTRMWRARCGCRASCASRVNQCRTSRLCQATTFLRASWRQEVHYEYAGGEAGEAGEAGERRIPTILVTSPPSLVWWWMRYGPGNALVGLLPPVARRVACAGIPKMTSRGYG